MGTSAGGLYALSAILEGIPANYSIPLIVVQHRAKDKMDLLEDILRHKCKVKIKQADEKEKIEAGNVYIAPPDYHLLVEDDHTFSLTSDEYVSFSRPSIDVLFESASIVYKDKLVGVILTGANKDGAHGISEIKKEGGVTIAQDPKEALFPFMPAAAIQTGAVMHTLKLSDILLFLLNLN